MRAFVPRKGDFISVTFDPQSGHEQKGRRPAMVVSNTLFNEQTSRHRLSCDHHSSRLPFSCGSPWESGCQGIRDG